MSCKYSELRDGVTTIASLLKYDAVVDEQGVIYKDCGNYLQMIVPIKVKGAVSKDHNTYVCTIRRLPEGDRYVKKGSSSV